MCAYLNILSPLSTNVFRFSYRICDDLTRLHFVCLCEGVRACPSICLSLLFSH